MQRPQYYIQKNPPTPPNTTVNKSNKWNNTLYPPYRNPTNMLIPTLPIFETNPILKFPPQYCYYTNRSFNPPKKTSDGHWKKKKQYTEYITLPNQKFKYPKGSPAYKQSSEPN